MKKVIFRLIGVGILGIAGWMGYKFFQGLPSRQVQTPTTRVRRGDVVVRSFTRGELRAVRSATLTAPNLFGTVQVTRLAPLGAFAKEKDLIVEFDDSEVQSRLDSKQLDLESTDEQIKKSEADLAIRNNQDQVDLLKARYAVRRSELEVKRNELLSAIDQKKNVLNLEEARRRLQQLESDIKSKQEQALAELAVLRERRNRALLDINREKMRLAQVKLLAPISGLVAIKQNRSGFSGMFGTQVPDIREGDQVPPGSQIADVLDLSELEVLARVGELDRANLRESQEVLIRLDALANKVFSGSIKSMSGTASANIFSSDPGKKFDVIFSIDMKQLLTVLGAKPDTIARIQATAEQNRKKPVAQPAPSLLAGGMTPDAGAQAMTFGGPPGAPGGGGGAPAPGMKQQVIIARPGDAPGGAPQMPPVSAPQIAPGADAGRGAVRNAASGAGASGTGAGPGMGRGAGAPPVAMNFGMSQQFSEKDLDNAKLPPPPGDSQLDVLLRPGLLADVEIIIEKVPNAIYLPNQCIFDKEGKLVVYVKRGELFEPHPVKVSKRSETVSVIAEGIGVGDIVAMADPTAKSGDKKGGKKGGGSGGAMGALPGGGQPKGGQ
jgi:HlyD family secretion protein